VASNSGVAAPSVACQGCDQRQVLLPEIQLHRRRLVLVANHQRPAQCEDTRSGGTAAEQLQHLRRIEADACRKPERLGRRDVVDRDQQVRDQLQAHAVAESADAGLRPCKAAEHRRTAPRRRGVTADIDHQVARLGLRSRAADRRIEQSDTGGGEPFPGARLGRNRQRAELQPVQPSCGCRHGCKCGCGCKRECRRGCGCGCECERGRGRE
jgi:hypothetical protein